MYVNFTSRNPSKKVSISLKYCVGRSLFFEKNSENASSHQKNAPQELSNEWSLSVGFDNLKFVWQFLCPALGDKSHHQPLKS
jgi:hypothetical protein